MICSLNKGPICYQIKPYKSFTNTTCNPRGWKQSNNDCWLDSSLYAMFAPKDSCAYFSDKLDRLNESKDEHEKNIALYISNYLQGIDLIKWSTMNQRTVENCKQKCKNEIVKHLLLWNASHHFPLGIGNADIQDSMFDTNRSDDIGNGPLHVLMKFFAEVNKESVHYVEPEPLTINSVCQGQPTPIHDIIDQQFRLERMHKQILIVSLNGIDRIKCFDQSTLQQLKTKQNYTLNSIVYGAGPHITSVTLCNNQYTEYDNQSDRMRTPVLDASTYFTDAEQLIFVYVKNTSGGKTRKWNKKSKKTKSKKAKSKKTKVKGGTVDYLNGKLVGRNINGHADVDVLNALEVRYRAPHDVNFIDLLNFYEHPNDTPKGFNMSFREALDAQSDVRNLTRISTLLYDAYQSRVRDGRNHYYRGTLPDQRHAHFAALLRWLSERVDGYRRGESITADASTVSGYETEFMNMFSQTDAPPVPRMGVEGVGDLDMSKQEYFAPNA